MKSQNQILCFPFVGTRKQIQKYLRKKCKNRDAKCNTKPGKFV